MTSITAAVKDDHEEMEEYYEKVINSDDADTKTRYGNQFVWELARHAVGEELVVYPAMEKHLGEEGKAWVAEDRQEHHKTKERLVTFQAMDGSDPKYDSTLKEIWKDLHPHNQTEEDRDLPKLEEALKKEGGGASEALAKSFSTTKQFLPTRAHPAAGEKPPFETVLAFLNAPIDKVTDIFRKFPQSD